MKRRLILHIKQYALFYLILLLLLFLGELIGILTAKRLDDTERNAMLEFLQSRFSGLGTVTMDGKKVFLSALLQDGKWLVLLFICGASRWLIPFGMLALILKGFSVGFSAAFLMQSYGTNGFLFELPVLGLFFLLTMPCFLFFANRSTQFSLNRHAGKKENRSTATYLGCFLLSAMLLTAAALLQAVMMPPLVVWLLPKLG